MLKILMILFVILNISLVSASCSDIYNFILNNNWDYNSEDLINNNITEEQIYNYPKECEALGEHKLPEKPSIPVLIIYKNNTEECYPTINKFFDLSLPLPSIEVGDLNCSDLNKLKWFVKLEKIGTYEIKGVKVWLMLPTFLIILLFSLLRVDSWTNKIFHRYIRRSRK